VGSAGGRQKRLKGSRVLTAAGTTVRWRRVFLPVLPGRHRKDPRRAAGVFSAVRVTHALSRGKGALSAERVVPPDVCGLAIGREGEFLKHDPAPLDVVRSSSFSSFSVSTRLADLPFRRLCLPIPRVRPRFRRRQVGVSHPATQEHAGHGRDANPGQEPPIPGHLSLSAHDPIDQTAFQGMFDDQSLLAAPRELGCNVESGSTPLHSACLAKGPSDSEQR
jgi:hypothetical protein